MAALSENRKTNGSIILLDSGNYESWWLRDKNWNNSAFNSVLKNELADLAFCFDNQIPPSDIEENSKELLKSTFDSQKLTESTTIIPIAHSASSDLAQTINRVCEMGGNYCIAIPERILGDGILARVCTITDIRKQLNKRDGYTFLHILGTGNPFTLALLSFAGADSFDGLEWCQTTVDFGTARLYHFQQRELFNHDCSFCFDSSLDYATATLGHNLLFFQNWMLAIQNAIKLGTETDFINQWFSQTIIDRLNEIWRL